MKIFITLLIAILIVSCSNENWTDDEQNTFVDACEEEGGTSNYCQCYLENIMNEFPIATDANEIDFEIKIELSKDCHNE